MSTQLKKELVLSFYISQHISLINELLNSKFNLIILVIYIIRMLQYNAHWVYKNMGDFLSYTLYIQYMSYNQFCLPKTFPNP